MKVKPFKGNSSVNLRDMILSLDWKLSQFSELDNIIEKVRTFPICIKTEIKHVDESLKVQCDDSDEVGSRQKQALKEDNHQ